MNAQKTIVIDINLTRGFAAVLTVGLLSFSLLGYLVIEHEEAAASSPKTITQGSAGMRQFYLTSTWDNRGDETINACADGYHFASLWEILDPSNLKYNTALGHTYPDSGSGPSTGIGWVRTGHYSHNSTSTEGTANCSAWTTTSGYGTTAKLVSNWLSGAEDVHVWEVFTALCDGTGHVWCIED